MPAQQLERRSCTEKPAKESGKKEDLDSSALVGASQSLHTEPRSCFSTHDDGKFTVEHFFFFSFLSTRMIM